MNRKIKGFGAGTSIALAELVLILLLVDGIRHFNPFSGGISARDLGYRVTRIEPWRRAAKGRSEAFIQQIDTGTIGWAPNQFLCASPFGSGAAILKSDYLWHIIGPAGSRLGSIAERGRDEFAQIPLAYISSRHIVVEWLDTKSRSLRKLILADPSSPIPTDKISLSFFAIEDIDGDGRPEIVVTIESGFFGMPRGILAYNSETGAKKWEYLTAGTPFQIEIADTNGDGRKEIFVSAWAPHNGVVYKDMDDDHSVLICLDGAGQRIWMDVLSGYFSEVRFAVGDINADGEAEIVTSRSCHRADDPDPGEINLINPRTGTILKTYREAGISFTQPFMVPRMDGRRDEIFVGDSSGRLRLLDGDLKVQKTVQFPRRAVVLGSFSPRPGKPPLVVADVDNSRLLVLDSELNILFEKDYRDYGATVPEMISLSDGRTEHAVVNADHMYLLTSTGAPFERRLAAYLFTPLTGILIMGFVYNFILAAYFMGRRRNRRLEAEAAVRERAQDWTSMVQEIVHNMKTPLFTVQLEAEKLAVLSNHGPGSDSPSDPARISDSILDDVKILNRQTRLLMQLISIPSAAREPGDLNALLRQIGEKYRDLFLGRIEFVLDFPDDDFVFPFNEVQLQEAFSNLLDNAIEAMPAGGRLRLATHARRNPRKDPPWSIIVEIEDNGCGIPQDRLGRIFEQSFSSKPRGLGFGLSITKRIVERHEGTIEVQSREGIGTRIAIAFPWKGR